MNLRFLSGVFVAGVVVGCARAPEEHAQRDTSQAISNAAVTLTGKAQSCYPGTPIRLVGVPGVNVSAFDTRKVPLLLSTLKDKDTTAAQMSSGGWPPRLTMLMRQSD